MIRRPGRIRTAAESHLEGETDDRRLAVARSRTGGAGRRFAARGPAGAAACPDRRVARARGGAGRAGTGGDDAPRARSSRRRRRCERASTPSSTAAPAARARRPVALAPHACSCPPPRRWRSSSRRSSWRSAAARARPPIPQTARLALAASTMPAPAQDAAHPGLLRLRVDGLAFPYYGRSAGWEATGARTDTLGGRRVLTVFYTVHGADRVGYSIVSGQPAQGQRRHGGQTAMASPTRCSGRRRAAGDLAARRPHVRDRGPQRQRAHAAGAGRDRGAGPALAGQRPGADRRSGPAGSSIPQLSRTRSAGTAAAEPSTDWWVIACGTSISDSTPPSDSASVNSRVRAAICVASGWRKLTMPLNPGQRTSVTPGAARSISTTAAALRAWASIRRCSVRSPRCTRKQSNGPGTAPTAFWTNRSCSYQSSSRVITTPPTTSECPPRYFVVECTTKSAPELQRTLVGRRGERVVDGDQRAAAAGDDALDVDHVEQRVGRRLDPDQARVVADRARHARPGRSGRPGRTARPQRLSTLSTSR